MKRRNFISKSIVTGSALAAGITAVNAQSAPKSKEIYELRVYELRRGQAPLDNFLSKALIPALNKSGVSKVGVFNEVGKSEPTKVYVLIPYTSFEHFGKVALELKKDKDFTQASTEYNQIPQETAVFNRYDSSLMIAFDGFPKLAVPQSGPRIFELRTYEGYSDDAVARKIKMFNEGGEFVIFDRVNLNSVFFGEVIAGKNLPCLTYMLTFKNIEERDANWKAFGQDPDWQKLLKDPQYANTVSKIYKTILEPVAYSQI